MKTRRPRPTLPKPVIRYAESYHAPGLKIMAFALPTLPSATGFEVAEAYVMKAGHLERGDERYEFQDVRIYLRERSAPATKADAVDPAVRESTE